MRSNRPNWENKALSPRVTLPPLALLLVTRFRPCPDLSHWQVASPAGWTPPPPEGNKQGAREEPLSIKPQDSEVLTCTQYIWASIVSQP